MFEIVDESILGEFERSELQGPSPRKEQDGRCVYTSRELGMPKKVGAPALCEFASTVTGGTEHVEDVQPNIYRALEVILEIPWTYSVDIWNVGCMVRRRLIHGCEDINHVADPGYFKGGHLSMGQDPEFKTYRSRAHLAEMISLLGPPPPPPDFVARGWLGQKFFSAEGKFLEEDIIPKKTILEERETTLEAEDKADFLRFVRRMLQWEPGKRGSARSLAEDDWIQR